MRKIGVIIPYFQRDPGILARALGSIAAQDVEDAQITVVIVDDSSPSPAEASLDGLAGTRLEGAVRVVNRANGGPGAARNTGLAAVAGAVDMIALFDSDDVWEPHHLRVAAASIERGADVFFANYEGINTPGLTYYSRIPEREPLLAMAAPEGDAYAVDGGLGSPFASLAATTYLAYTSTIVFRADRFPGVRFAERPSMGEDHLFFLDLVLAARRIGFSLTSATRQGFGLHVYAKSLVWGTDADIVRRIYNLGKAKTILRRAPWPEETRRALETALAGERRIVAWLLLRKAVTDRALPLAALRTAMDVDPTSVAAAPFLALAFLTSRRAAEAA